MEIEIKKGIKNYLRISTMEATTPKVLGQLLILIDELYRLKLFTDNLEFTSINKEVSTPEEKILRAIFGDKDKIGTNYISIDNTMHNISKEEYDIILQTINNPIESFFSIRVIDFVTNKFKNDLLLRIARISMNSPIKISFFGIPEIIEKIKDFIISMTKLKSEIKREKIENALKLEELRTKRLENIEKFLDLDTKHELRKYLLNSDEGLGLLEEKINDTLRLTDKITKIETIREDEL